MIQGKLDGEQKEKHKSCKICMYCNTHLPDEEKNRVIDHDHITGKYFVVGVTMIFTILCKK